MRALDALHAEGRRPVYGRGQHRNRRDGTMNAVERRYAAELELRRMRGEILRWDFEPETLRVASVRATYTPDFRVMLTGGEIEFHEVKGGVFEAAAKLRLKVAADSHPYRFLLVRARLKRDGGGWAIEEV